MQFFVVEKFKPGAFDAVYTRLRESGRMLPVGLNYVSSWVATDKTQCFQLMETDDESLFDQWIKHWSDLVDFEVFPVETGQPVVSGAIANPVKSSDSDSQFTSHWIAEAKFSREQAHNRLGVPHQIETDRFHQSAGIEDRWFFNFPCGQSIKITLNVSAQLVKVFAVPANFVTAQANLSEYFSESELIVTET